MKLNTNHIIIICLVVIAIFSGWFINSFFNPRVDLGTFRELRRANKQLEKENERMHHEREVYLDSIMQVREQYSGIQQRIDSLFAEFNENQKILKNLKYRYEKDYRIIRAADWDNIIQLYSTIDTNRIKN